MSWNARRLVQGLREVDFNRFPASAAAAGTFKQWVHVAVMDPSLTFVANFSSIAERAHAAAHRLTVLAFAGEVEAPAGALEPHAVRAHVRRFDPDHCALPLGGTALRFGDNRLVAAGDVHELSLDEPALALRAHLTLRAATRLSVLHDLQLGSGGAFSWAVVPRLLASGTVEYEGHTRSLVDAPAYRDRNWGSFCFGDVSWDWGYVTAASDGPPCAIVFVRLMNAARTRILDQEVLVWWGNSLLASFRDRSVAFVRYGAVEGPLATVPPALALCRPGHATEVAQALSVIARSSRGELEFRFERSATARIIVPNDGRPGTSVIYESSGRGSAAGRVDGQAIDLRGPCFFEHVHA